LGGKEREVGKDILKKGREKMSQRGGTGIWEREERKISKSNSEGK
jgi:hypothetical protein